MTLSRRRIFELGAAGLLLPRRLMAAPAAGDRKLLIVFVHGGWDPTWGIAPMYDSASVDSNPSGEPAESGGIPYVASGDTPSLTTFFETYADRCCLVHGFEVRSVTHERCRRLLMTGKSTSEADDWPSQVAGHSSGYLLPHVVVSGPSYSSTYTSSVIRLGETGQLSGLLDGSALDHAEPPIPKLRDASAEVVQRYLASRAETYAAAAGAGRQQRIAADLLQSSEQLALIRELDLDLSVELEDITPVPTLLGPALDCLELGYSRAAIVSHRGQYNVGWDSHSGIDQQLYNYEVLFDDLITILEDLDSRTGSSGGRLSDEVTVVVVSEMGRSPQLNALDGKDHWTFTSALFIGAGVAGGRVVGGYDDELVGQAVDFTSGEVSEAGELMGSEHIGATILALMDVEPEEEPIAAVMG